MRRLSPDSRCKGFYSLSKEAKDTRKSQNSRVEYDVLHMYTRQEVEIGAGIFSG